LELYGFLIIFTEKEKYPLEGFYKMSNLELPYCSLLLKDNQLLSLYQIQLNFKD